MNNAIWTARIQKLLEQSSGHFSDQCRADWAELLIQTESAHRDSVSEWHIEQTRGFLATFLRKNDQAEKAMCLEERIGDDAESWIRYWHVVAGSALARAALDQFEFGDNEKAAVLAKRSLTHLGESSDPSPIFEELICRLREYREAEQDGRGDGDKPQN